MLYCSRAQVLKVQRGAYKLFKQCQTFRSPILPYVGDFPFIVQDGAPIYIYLSLCIGSTGESFVFVSRRGPLDQSGVGRLESGWFSWAAGCLRAVPSLVSRDGSRHSDGRSGSSLVLSVCTYASYPQCYHTASPCSLCLMDSTPDEGCLTAARRSRPVTPASVMEHRCRGGYHYGMGGDVC